MKKNGPPWRSSVKTGGEFSRTLIKSGERKHCAGAGRLQEPRGDGGEGPWFEAGLKGGRGRGQHFTRGARKKREGWGSRGGEKETFPRRESCGRRLRGVLQVRGERECRL